MAEGRRKAGPMVAALRSGLAGSFWAIVALVASPLRFVRWLADWLHWWRGTRRRRLMAMVVLGLVVLGAIGTRVYRMDMRFEQARIDPVTTAETSYLLPPAALELLSFGRPSFASDLVFIRANMYFVSHLFGDRVFKWLDPYVETMLALDPNNPRLYQWASQAAKYGRGIDEEALERSNALARRGLERFPDDWRLYFDIGFNYFMEWPTDTKDEKEQMRQKALPYFSIAAALPGSELDPNFLASMYLRGSDVDMALFHAYLRYWEASDQERRALRNRIERFQSAAVANRLADEEARWKSEYPYLPFGLFEVLGPDRGRSVPGSWAHVVEDTHPAPSAEAAP